jgi:hypothetical protein
LVPVEKVSVSLDPGLVSDARKLAESTGTTLSGLVGEAIEYRLKLARASNLLADWEAEHGPITGAERDRVRARWPA